MIRSNSKKAIENIRKYITENFDCSAYDMESPSDFKGIAKTIITTFETEKWKWEKGRKNHLEAFTEWASGLPTILDCCYYYSRSAVKDVAMILEESTEEANKYTESEAEKLLTWLIYRECMKACRK